MHFTGFKSGTAAHIVRCVADGASYTSSSMNSAGVKIRKHGKEASSPAPRREGRSCQPGAKLLGHAQVRTNARYAHLAADLVKAAAQAAEPPVGTARISLQPDRYHSISSQRGGTISCHDGFYSGYS